MLAVAKVCVPVKPPLGVSPTVPGTVTLVPMVSLERYADVLISVPTKENGSVAQAQVGRGYS